MGQRAPDYWRASARKSWLQATDLADIPSQPMRRCLHDRCCSARAHGGLAAPTLGVERAPGAEIENGDVIPDLDRDHFLADGVAATLCPAMRPIACGTNRFNTKFSRARATATMLDIRRCCWYNSPASHAKQKMKPEQQYAREDWQTRPTSQRCRSDRPGAVRMTRLRERRRRGFAFFRSRFPVLTSTH
jgi:hypothetical protein